MLCGELLLYRKTFNFIYNAGDRINIFWVVLSLVILCCIKRNKNGKGLYFKADFTSEGTCKPKRLGRAAGRRGFLRHQTAREWELGKGKLTLSKLWPFFRFHR